MEPPFYVDMDPNQTSGDGLASHNSVDVRVYNDDSLGPSDVYYGVDGPLEYVAAYSVHASSTGDDRTRVQVKPREFKVVVGTEWACGHAFSQYVYKDVPSTTIDEYRIILAVAKCAGVTGLPQVRTPTRRQNP
jgi:hypothetical protein